MTWLVASIVVVLGTAFVVAAWSPRLLAARDRLSLVLTGLTAATVTVVGRALIDWSLVPIAVWYLVIALLAAGVVGGVLRWRNLPRLADPAKRTARIWSASVSVVFLVVVAAVFTY